MRPLLLAVTAVAALLLIGSAPAGVECAERATPAEGWTWMEQVRWQTTGHTRAVMGGLTVRDRDSVRETTYTCTVQVDAVEDGRPSELELRFAEASLSEDGEPTKLELAGGAYRATGLGEDRSFRTADGKRVKRKPRRFLEQQFGDGGNDDPVELLLPEHAVAVGETWPLDMDQFVEYLGRDRFTLDEEASRATATLTGLVDRDGVEYGQIAFDVLVVPLEITDGTFTQAHMGLTGTAELPLSAAVPYQALEVTVDIRFLGTVRRKAVTIDLDLDLETAGTVKLAAL